MFRKVKQRDLEEEVRRLRILREADARFIDALQEDIRHLTWADMEMEDELGHTRRELRDLEALRSFVAMIEGAMNELRRYNNESTA